MNVHIASTEREGVTRQVCIAAGNVRLDGELSLPADAGGVVIFAHGSGSSRHSPRNQHVARVLCEAGLSTLLLDLLTHEEEIMDRQTAQLRFDIGLLAQRLIGASHWAAVNPETRRLRPGYFGSSTGGGAALVAAADPGLDIGAVVSRGGRPDLAGSALLRVKAPTLLIVGELDEPAIKMNEEAYALLKCEKELKIVPGATHLFEEPGALEEVAGLAAEWFCLHLNPQ